MSSSTPEAAALSRLAADELSALPSLPFAEEYGFKLGSTHHITLLNHPAVYERLRVWRA